MKSKRVLIAAIAAAFLAVSCTPTTTPASTTTSEVAVSTSTTSLLAPAPPTLLDANGVELGTYLTADSFYNTDIKRIVVFSQNDGKIIQYATYYKELDCGGNKYLFSPNQIRDYPYVYLISNGANGSYLVKSDVAGETLVPVSLYVDGACLPVTSPGNFVNGKFYELTRVSVPFDYQLAFPFRLK